MAPCLTLPSSVEVALRGSPLIGGTSLPYEDMSSTAEHMEDMDTGDTSVLATLIRSRPVRFGRVPKTEKERIRAAMETASSLGCSRDVSDEALVAAITKSHVDTCHVTRQNIRDVLTSADHARPADPTMVCPLDPYAGSDDFNQKFSPIVREVVTFAKNIPSFQDFIHEDKITLLRACVFEVLLIRFSALIDPRNKRMLSISGSIIFSKIYENSKATSDLAESIFKFVERVNSLNLAEIEVALFTAAVVTNPKRQGIRETSRITSIHRKIVSCLHAVMQRERPNNPNLSHELLGALNELLVLNDLHSKHAQTRQKHHSGSSSDADQGSFHFDSSDRYGSHSRVEMKHCPVRHRQSVDDGVSSNFSQDEAMQSPGSADSGCSIDSGESDLSYDHYAASHQSTDQYRSHTISSDSFPSYYKNKSSSLNHKSNETVKVSDSPVLRMCLEAPSSLKIEGFNEYCKSTIPSHPHKKFRPVGDRIQFPHETLDSCSTSPRSSISPSRSFANSPSPSPISSSPSTMSPFTSSDPSSPASSMSILAHRLAMPVKRYPRASSLLETLKQESRFSADKVLMSDQLHDCIMNGQSKVEQGMSAPFPRYDDPRTISPMHTQSPPYALPASPYPSPYTSPYPHSVSSPPAQPTPSGLGASAMSGCPSPNSFGDDAQPLNLSTKTPSPSPSVSSMEA